MKRDNRYNHQLFFVCCTDLEQEGYYANKGGQDLASGLDTESIVNALMSAQRTKQTKVENKKQKLEWKQEIWEGTQYKDLRIL